MAIARDGNGDLQLAYSQVLLLQVQVGQSQIVVRRRHTRINGERLPVQVERSLGVAKLPVDVPKQRQEMRDVGPAFETTLQFLLRLVIPPQVDIDLSQVEACPQQVRIEVERLLQLRLGLGDHIDGALGKVNLAQQVTNTCVRSAGQCTLQQFPSLRQCISFRLSAAMSPTA